jgi:hypothetical protein
MFPIQLVLPASFLLPMVFVSLTPASNAQESGDAQKNWQALAGNDAAKAFTAILPEIVQQL